MKHSDIKFTIIISMYNVEKYIEQALKSCVSQTCKNVEILVINDGSTDSSPLIAQRYADQYENVRMITTENRGLSMARNEGILQASGEWLLFLDGDDWLEPTAVESCRGVLQADLDVFFYNVRDCYDDGERIVRVEEREKYRLVDQVCTGREVANHYNRYLISVESWRGCYRKLFLTQNDIFFVPGVIWEDNAFWLQIILRAKSIMYSNLYLYNYRVRKGSIMRSSADHKKIESVFVLHEVMLGELEKQKAETTYAVVCAYMLSGLMKVCGRLISTDYQESLEEDYPDIIRVKERILKQIDQIYWDLSVPDVLKIKYQLCCALVFFTGIYNEAMLHELEKLKKKTFLYLKERMSSFPLQVAKKVGIYGSGRNADVILDTYRKVIGEIKADYVYIDSRKESFVHKHLNRNVVNVADLCGQGIKDVVICSNLYEDEMDRTLRSYYDNIFVYKMYESNKVNIEEILTENYYELYQQLCRKNKPRILLIGTPEYFNIGDHLIVLGERQFFADMMPEYEVVEITNRQYTLYKSALSRVIEPDDKIVVTGGGFLGSLWTDELYDEVLDLVKGYQDHQIIIFPQSVYFEDNASGNAYRNLTKEIFSQHKHLTVCVRERRSYRRLTDLLGSSDQVRLFPDIALYYRPKEKYITAKPDGNKKNNRQIGVFLRNDKESVLSEEQKQGIIRALEQIGGIEYFSMQYETSILAGDREQAVAEKLDQISAYSLVVTDALHCMISCALTGVPCVAVNNISFKVEGVFEWIKDIGTIRLFNPAQSSDFEECVRAVLDGTYREDAIRSLEKYWISLSKTIR